ncbi:MAG: hypothetical protein ACREP6_11850, partial [Candidatus Binataceae bacterium]
MAGKVLSPDQWARLNKVLEKLEKSPPKPRYTITEFLRQNRGKIAQILAKHPEIRPIDIVRAFKEDGGVDASEQTIREVIRGRRGILKRQSFKVMASEQLTAPAAGSEKPTNGRHNGDTAE